MVSGDAILAATSVVGVAVLTGGWRLASMLSKLQTRLDTHDEKLTGINTVVSSAAILNGHGDKLVRDVAEMKDDLRRHITNDEATQSALWAAVLDAR